jgi:hypothetical protein
MMPFESTPLGCGGRKISPEAGVGGRARTAFGGKTAVLDQLTILRPLPGCQAHAAAAATAKVSEKRLESPKKENALVVELSLS